MSGETGVIEGRKRLRTKRIFLCEQVRNEGYRKMENSYPLSLSAIEGILAEVGNLGLDSLLFDLLPPFEGGVLGNPFPNSGFPNSTPSSKGGAFGDLPRSNELAFRKFEELEIESFNNRGEPVGGGVAAFALNPP